MTSNSPCRVTRLHIIDITNSPLVFTSLITRQTQTQNSSLIISATRGHMTKTSYIPFSRKLLYPTVYNCSHNDRSSWKISDLIPKPVGVGKLYSKRDASTETQKQGIILMFNEFSIRPVKISKPNEPRPRC